MSNIVYLCIRKTIIRKLQRQENYSSHIKHNCSPIVNTNHLTLSISSEYVNMTILEFPSDIFEMTIVFGIAFII